MNWKKSSVDAELSSELAYALRRDAMRKADRSSEFWAGQQARIESKMTAARPRQARPLRFALAAAALLLCVALVADRGSKPVPPPAPHAQVDADHELLLTIERSLAAGTPRALQPVALVNDSDSRNLSDSTKEHQNEN
jgi:hypothetical protein